MLQESQKLKDPAHIWDEVTEETKSLCILDCDHNHAHLKFMQRNPIKQNLWPSLPSRNFSEPLNVINIREYPPDSVNNLKGLPENLPNLEYFDIKYVKFQSLEGIPEHLPKLQILSIMDSEISSLESLPPDLPSLKSIVITKCPITSFKGIPKTLPSLEKLSVTRILLSSLKYFPKSIPKIEKLRIDGENLTSLRFFPKTMPNLKSLTIGNKLTSLKGMPRELPALEELGIWGNLATLEYLPEVINKRLNKFFFDSKPLRTLSGIKNRKFFNWVAFYRFQDKFENLHPKGLKLIKETHKHIEETVFDDETQEYVNLSYWERDDAKYDELVEYYTKTPLALTLQYINHQKYNKKHSQNLAHNQKSLSKDELERLEWEAGHKERQLLENSLCFNDPVINCLNNRFSIETNGGFEIKI